VVGDDPSCALLGGFAIGARLGCYGNITRSVVAILQFVSDIAVFVLKREVKLQATNQPTNQPTNKLVSTSRYDNIVRTRNVSECFVVALCLVIVAVAAAAVGIKIRCILTRCIRVTTNQLRSCDLSSIALPVLCSSAFHRACCSNKTLSTLHDTSS